MCQSKTDGGRRCAAHTRPAYRAAIDAILDEPDFAKKAQILEAHKDAVLAYAATPTGSKDFWIESGALAGDARRQIERGTSAEQAAAAEFEAAVRLAETQASIRAEVDREVLRRIKFERTGTHAGELMPECATFHRDGAGLTIAPDDYAKAMTKGRYDSGTAETVDWCDEAEAHHGFARVNAPYENSLHCLHCQDRTLGGEPSYGGSGGGSNVNRHGLDMTPGQAPALTRM